MVCVYLSVWQLCWEWGVQGLEGVLITQAHSFYIAVKATSSNTFGIWIGMELLSNYDIAFLMCMC